MKPVTRRTFLAAAAAATLRPATAGPPAVVTEVTGVLGSSSSLVELKDGSLLANDGRTSRDGGATWSAPRTFDTGVAGAGLLRLESGAIALVSQLGYAAGHVWLSRDEGTSWQSAGPIRTPG